MFRFAFTSRFALTLLRRSENGMLKATSGHIVGGAELYKYRFAKTRATRASQQGRQWRVNKLLLALGANLPAAWGSPRQTLQRAERELWRAGLRTLSVSHVYDTLPLGPGRQAPYVNAVLLLARGCSARSPAAARQENRAAGRPPAWRALGTALPRHRYPRLRRQADWLAQAPTSARDRPQPSVGVSSCHTRKCINAHSCWCRCSRSPRIGAIQC